MKKFINSIIRLLIHIITFLFLAILCFIIYMMFFSKENDITLEDTVSYLQSFGNQIINNSTDNNSAISSFNTSNEELVKIDDTYNNYPITTKKKFYYDQLDETSKMIYISLENNIDNLKKENYTINFSTQFNTLLNQPTGQEILNSDFQTALDAFFYDHPELFYIDLTKISLVIEYTTIGPKTTYQVSLSPQSHKNYLYNQFQSEEHVEQAIASIENVKNIILNSVPNSNDYQKALKVHDILVRSLEYDSSRANAHNVYGALVEKKVVCEGYAKAYKYILDSLGIECILVNGTATNSSGQMESHMWNYIKLDGNWYGVDVTWDDPVIVGGSTTQNIVRHNYFAKGFNVFNNSHVINNRISDEGKTFNIPTLSSRNYK